MKPNKKQVMKFIEEINLSKFVTVGKISCFQETVYCELVEFKEDPGIIHNQIAKMFNLKSVDSQDEFGNICYMVNMPNYGSFGIKRTKSNNFDGYNFDFVIYDKKFFKEF